MLHPGTLQPIGPDDLAPLFPMSLIEQEVTTEREVEIPEPVREVFRLWRPAPLYRAHRLEKVLGTPAKIFYKYEGVSPAGSHKPTSAIPQAFYNAQAGIKRLTTETGAGQWGSSLAMAGQLFGLTFYGYAKIGTTHFVSGDARHENHVLLGSVAKPLRQGVVSRAVRTLR